MLCRVARGRAAALASVARPRVIARAYHQDLIDHYENPRNVGRLDKKAPNVGTGLVGAPACGDVMQLQIQVDDDGTISESKFKTFGCGSAIASSSLATEVQYPNSPPPTRLQLSYPGSDTIMPCLFGRTAVAKG